MVLAGTIEPGDKVRVSVSDGELSFDVDKGGAEELVEQEEAKEAEREPAVRA